MKIQDSIQEQIHMEHVSMRQSNIALSDNILQNRLILTEPVLNILKVFRLMKHFLHDLWLTALQKMSAARKAFPLKGCPIKKNRLRKEPTNRIPWPLQGPCIIYEGA